MLRHISYFRRAESICFDTWQLSFSCTNLWCLLQTDCDVILLVLSPIDMDVSVLDFTYSSFSVTLLLRRHPWNNKGDLTLILDFLFIISWTSIHCLWKTLLQHSAQTNTWQRESEYIWIYSCLHPLILTDSVPLSQILFPGEGRCLSEWLGACFQHDHYIFCKNKQYTNREKKINFSIHNGISNLRKAQTTFLPNAHIIYLAKSIISRSNIEKQAGMSPIPRSCKALTYYCGTDLNGFRILYPEHVLGQDPVASIYFSPRIFSVQGATECSRNFSTVSKG